MRAFIKENLYLIALWILCIAGICAFCGHYANILLDVGREVYYPERILQGKVLYRDLFNIYGPLSYLWNALLYKLFGTNLNTLYISGAICSLGIVTAVYFIAKRFLSPLLSFSIGIFTIATGVCATHLFNYTFPYSWAMLYGTMLSLFALFFLLKFKDDSSAKYIYLSAFLSGCAVACKYEFLLFYLVVLVVALCTKNLKVTLKTFAAFIAAPVLSFGILFMQGLQIQDFIKNVQDINTMMHTSSLHYFYKHSGVLFSIPILIYWVVNFIKASIGCVTIFAGIHYLQTTNKEAGAILSLIGVILTYKLANPAIFAFLIGGTIIFALIRFKNIKSSGALLILTAGTIALSLKSLWGLTPLNYGNYYCPLVLTAFFALLFTVLDKKLEKAAGIYLLAVSVWFLLFNIRPLKELNTRILSPRGKIYTSKAFAEPINSTLSFLNNKSGSMTVFPEGLMLNFLANQSRISDDYYNSLIPLYVETFGDKKLIEHFSQNQPDYIVFSNQKMEDYNTGYICKDYANEFCSFVMQNYKPAASFGEDFGFFVYKTPSK